MSEPIFPSDEALETMLQEAKDLKASVSLRAMGTNRMMGDLHLAGIEPGVAMHLMGAKRRDQLPEEGTMLTLSIILGDQVVSLDSPLLAPTGGVRGGHGDFPSPPHCLAHSWHRTEAPPGHEDGLGGSNAAGGHPQDPR